MNENIALAGRIRESKIELEHVVARTILLAEKALQLTHSLTHSHPTPFWD